MSIKTLLHSASIDLIYKLAVLAGHWAGVIRYQAFQSQFLDPDESFKEIIHLRSLLEEQNRQISILKMQLNERTSKTRYSDAVKISIMIYMAYFQLPNIRVKSLFGIAISTFYEWRKSIDNADRSNFVPANKTPDDVVQLVWKLAADNFDAGRHFIANQLNLLGIAISDSTVRNILGRSRPPKRTKSCDTKSCYKQQAPIEAFYPNHIWSVDLTLVDWWFFGKRYVLVAIDHFSRKVVAANPVDGPNSAWTIDSLEAAFRKHGPPKHIISDQQTNFAGKPFHNFLEAWGIEQRFGAIGKHGSIAITERVIRTLKYEWLFRVPVIRGGKHLENLCASFQDWYNNWRPHMTLGGFRPCDYFQRNLPEQVPKDAKTIPPNIERKVFDDTKVVAYRLKNAA